MRQLLLVVRPVLLVQLEAPPLLLKLQRVLPQHQLQEVHPGHQQLEVVLLPLHQALEAHLELLLLEEVRDLVVPGVPQDRHNQE